MPAIMRTILAAMVLTACSSTSPTAPASAPAVAPATDVSRYISVEVTGAMRASPEVAPILTVLADLIKPPPACWAQLVTAMRATYQLEVSGHGSYFVFEGPLPQAEVERCVTTALTDVLPIHLRKDGELAVFESPAGTVYAAWRGPFVIAGNRAQVTAAIGPSAPAQPWRDRLGALPAGVMAMWRGDALVTNLFGVPTTSYQLAITSIARTPKAGLTGQLVAVYASASQAAQAAARIHAGELQTAVAPPPGLVEAFRRMKVTQRDATVIADFDLDTFGDLDLTALQGWLARLAALR
jgi:hypothetical protein